MVRVYLSFLAFINQEQIWGMNKKCECLFLCMFLQDKDIYKEYVKVGNGVYVYYNLLMPIFSLNLEACSS